MSNKSAIHAALNKLATTAIRFAPVSAGPELMVLRNAAADAVRALPDAPAVASVSGERDRLLSECKQARADSAKLTEQIASLHAFGSAVKSASEALTITSIPTLTLIELRKQTALLEVLGKQGDAASEGIAVRCDAPLRAKPVTAPAKADPFAPVFELDGDGADGKLGVTITLKPGTVVYLVTASGPRSNAITYSAAGPRHLLVRPVVEIEPGS